MVHRVHFLIVASIAIVLWISALPLASAQNECSNDQDCFNNPMYGQFSKCIDRVCHCLDFFVLSPLDNGCINAVPAGKSCMYTDQCIGAMGNHGRCNRTTGVCDCEQLTDVKIVIHEGRCTQVRGHGATCIDDEQCIVGSNEFARCNNDTTSNTKICGCLENKIAKFVVDGNTHVCVPEKLECEDSGVDLSVFAATMAGSAVLLVFIVVIFRLTNPNRKGNQQHIIQRSSQPVPLRDTMHSTPSGSTDAIMPGHSNLTKVEIHQ